jgi:hypothetical protein
MLFPRRRHRTTEASHECIALGNPGGAARHDCRLLTIARFDHASKHIFIVPGILLAYLLRGVRADSLVRSVGLGFAAVLFVASANYVINEWFDRFHPTKVARICSKVTEAWLRRYAERSAFRQHPLGAEKATREEQHHEHEDEADERHPVHRHG